MQKILDGRKAADFYKEKIKNHLQKIALEQKQIPHLAILFCDNHEPTKRYIKAKMAACEEVGIGISVFEMDVKDPQFLLEKIKVLNQNPAITGILVQLPLPIHFPLEQIISTIDPQKDVDGFHPLNIGKMALGFESFIPATPRGILKLFEFYQIDVQGKNCVIIGRSKIVGLPLSILLSQKKSYGNAIVTLLHSQTSHLTNYTQKADILIVAAGQKGLITQEMVSPKAIVIDVGIHAVVEEGVQKLKGDTLIDPQNVAAITPVPGGVGPMTIVGLLFNILDAAGISLENKSF